MRGIGRQLAIWLSFLLIIICLSLGIISYISASGAVIHEIEKVLPQKAEDVANLVKERINARISELEAVAARSEIISRADISCNFLLAARLNKVNMGG